MQSANSQTIVRPRVHYRNDSSLNLAAVASEMNAIQPITECIFKDIS